MEELKRPLTSEEVRKIRQKLTRQSPIQYSGEGEIIDVPAVVDVTDGQEVVVKSVPSTPGHWIR